MDDFIFWGVVLIIVISGVVLVWYYGRPRKSGLSKATIKYYREFIYRTEKLTPAEQIMQYDKILSHILREYGYEGSLGDQLKARPSIIRDIDETWRLHKLRNRLAHDLTEISASTLKKEAKNFEKLLSTLLS